MTALPRAFLDRPLAHRALHDAKQGRVENSLGAIEAAIAQGYGLEIDVQLTGDGEALVFHDPELVRLTGLDGRVRDHSLAEMTRIPLKHSAEAPPPLAEVLTRVAGRVPLLVELKSHPSKETPEDGALARAVARALATYDGPVAVMSFNPDAVASFQTLSPDCPIGLVTKDFATEPGLTQARADHLSAITDFDRVGASFISHDRRSLQMAPVHALKSRGVPVLTWTIRSPEEAKTALETADNITFEGYLP
ncbi:glycerophosphodiester phosphodiesterase family protein [Dinoroseobacter sp. S76]|uniref:glycerophosphodiester phosphodiesterase family protein n=1 Tax=Dinoroseobacter sp. S76 TaxID=3415124 RepID=UPI003C7CE543